MINISVNANINISVNISVILISIYLLVNPVLLRRLQPSAPSNQKRLSKTVLVHKPIGQ